MWWINLALKVNQAKRVWEVEIVESILASGCDVLMPWRKKLYRVHRDPDRLQACASHHGLEPVNPEDKLLGKGTETLSGKQNRPGRWQVSGKRLILPKLEFRPFGTKRRGSVAGCCTLIFQNLCSCSCPHSQGPQGFLCYSFILTFYLYMNGKVSFF